MKTYLFDSINRFKRWSESLDVATLLTNKTWVAFNDTNERELYIFLPDGSAIITCNGVGVKGTWKYISANNSLIICNNESVLMLHAEYVDELVLALKLDGTNNCAFLIEDKNRDSFEPKSLYELSLYFEHKIKMLELQKKEEEIRQKEKFLLGNIPYKEEVPKDEKHEADNSFIENYMLPIFIIVFFLTLILACLGVKVPILNELFNMSE